MKSYYYPIYMTEDNAPIAIFKGNCLVTVCRLAKSTYGVVCHAGVAYESLERLHERQPEFGAFQPETVHALRHGVPLCNVAGPEPAVGQMHMVTCTACLDASS